MKKAKSANQIINVERMRQLFKKVKNASQESLAVRMNLPSNKMRDAKLVKVATETKLRK